MATAPALTAWQAVSTRLAAAEQAIDGQPIPTYSRLIANALSAKRAAEEQQATAVRLVATHLIEAGHSELTAARLIVEMEQAYTAVLNTPEDES